LISESDTVLKGLSATNYILLILKKYNVQSILLQ